MKNICLFCLFIMAPSTVSVQGIDVVPGGKAIAQALSAGKVAYEATVENIANQYTQGYKANKVQFETMPMADGDGNIEVVSTEAAIVIDQSTGVKVYDPTSSDADQEGMVEGSNVILSREMVNATKYGNYINALYALDKVSIDIAKNAISIAR